MLIVRIFCMAAFSWICGSLTSKAAVLANYQFSSGSVASSDSDGLSTAGNFIFSGAPSSTEAAASSSTHMAYFRTSSLTPTAAGAVTNNDYFSFSFTPAVGQAYNLSSLTFDFGGSNTTGGDDFTTFAFLRTNAAGDNFTTNVDGLVSKVVNAGGNENQLQSFSIDLSSLSQFQNLSTTTEFRFTCTVPSQTSVRS